ncbi:MAG TPA: protein kinase [Vicinamibacterales bacterium]|jgi:tetratricopeptide (TPR) repeat protein/predicted Ser/Thr protein kinase|nr:protein kinase [Vicinamibacterales bacterium]
MLQTGDRVRQYEIQNLLGAGGMGSVYLAFDGRLQRSVAIKLIHAEDDREAPARILAEARSVSALNHPNICTVYEVAEDGNRPFIVMEYIEGQPLSELIAAGRAPRERVMDVAMQIVGAVAHAHERGVVHGDLKTANVLLTASGRIKVVDFGLARRPAVGDAAMTETGYARGTPHAMSPEQLRGAPADTRSDVWSVGVLLQELVGGSKPFDRATVPELMAAILTEPATPPPPHVDPAVRRVIERCLTRDPENRYQRAGEALAALEAISGQRSLHGISAIDPSQIVIAPPPAFARPAEGQTALVGRDSELGAMRASWDRARAGRRQLVLVGGEPGIGKTRFVGEFARSIADGGITLLGRSEQEALVPYQPFVEAIEWYARECPLGLLEAQLGNVDGVRELAHLVPALRRRAAVPADQVESSPEGQRYRLFEATAALLSAIAQSRPLLIVLEDLHWADRPTLLMLRHLVRSSHEAPLCLVATYRETELGRTHPLAEILADLRRDEGVVRIGLRGLSEAHVEELITHSIGRDSPSTLTRAVAENTEGNPFFIGEVLRHLTETGALTRFDQPQGARGGKELGVPEGVREVIGRRLARLSDPCNRVLGLAAVVGREFSLPVLQALADLPEDRLLDVVDEALGARLVQEAPGVPGRYAFTHALVRDTLYAEPTTTRRARLHRQVAETIERLAPPGNEPLADLAYHYSQAASAADAERAITYAVRAAERAAAAFALEEAARFYNLALQALDFLPADRAARERRLDLHSRRGRAFGDLGMWAPARQELERALDLIDPGPTVQRAEVLGQLSKCAFWMLDTPAVRRYAGEELTIAESLGHDDLVADAMSWVAGVMNADGDVVGAAEMDRQAMARIGGARTFGLSRTVITLYHLGRIDEAVQRAVESIESSRTAPDPNFRVYALQHLGISLAAAGRYAEARKAFDELRTFGRQYGVLPMLARGIAMAAGVEIALGDYKRGEATAHEARELARRVSFAPPLVSSSIDLLFVYARTHEPGRADAIVDDVAASVAAASGWHGWLWRLRMSEARAELALARGHWDEAVTAASECIEDSRARSRKKYEILGLITRARARSGLNKVSEARDDASRAVGLARTLGDPIVLLSALNALLAIDGTDALADEARASVTRIVGQLDDRRLRESFLASELVRSTSVHG